MKQWGNHFNQAKSFDGARNRRQFIGVTALSGARVASLSAQDHLARAAEIDGVMEKHEMLNENHMADEINKEKIRRATLAGPSLVTSDATIAEMNRHGIMTVLRSGTNEWVCIPGDEHVVGWPDMALDPMGMVWFKDLLVRKVKPTNTSPGLIYMLNGATAEVRMRLEPDKCAAVTSLIVRACRKVRYRTD